MGLTFLLAVVLGILAVVAIAGLRVRGDSTIQPATSADRVAYQVAKDRRSAESLLSHFKLRKRDTEFFGEWRETRAHGHRIAFQPGSPLSVMVGEFDPDEEQLAEVYLSKVSTTRPMPESKTRRLDPHVGDEGRSLANNYFLNAALRSDHALKVAEVRRALLELSPAVLDVMIYETHGVQLDLDPTHATTASLNEDLARAAAIVDTLQGDAPDTSR